MRVEPFKPEHLLTMNVQEAQRGALPSLTPEYAQRLQNAGPAFTGFVDGRVIGCAGVGYLSSSNAILWSVLAEGAGRHMVGIHRCALRLLSTLTIRRIEADVLKGFEPGCRWLEKLGFEYEGPLRAYGEDGSDYMRYARIR